MANLLPLLCLIAVVSTTPLFSSLENFEMAENYLLLSARVFEMSGSLNVRELVKGVPKGADPSSPPKSPKYVVIDSAPDLGRVTVGGQLYVYTPDVHIVAFIRDQNASKTSSLGSKAPVHKHESPKKQTTKPPAKKATTKAAKRG